MLSNTSALNSEQTQTLDKLHQAFAALCHSYGDLNHYYGFSQFVDSRRIDWMLEEIENLSLEVSALRIDAALANQQA